MRIFTTGGLQVYVLSLLLAATACGGVDWEPAEFPPGSGLPPKTAVERFVQAEVNGDGVPDIVEFHHPVGGYTRSWLLARDGRSGLPLWVRKTHPIVYSSVAGADAVTSSRLLVRDSKRHATKRVPLSTQVSSHVLNNGRRLWTWKIEGLGLDWRIAGGLGSPGQPWSVKVHWRWVVVLLRDKARKRWLAVLDFESGRLLWKAPALGGYNNPTFSGDYLITTARHGRQRIWHLETGKSRLSPPPAGSWSRYELDGSTYLLEVERRPERKAESEDLRVPRPKPPRELPQGRVAPAHLLRFDAKRGRFVPQPPLPRPAAHRYAHYLGSHGEVLILTDSGFRVPDGRLVSVSTTGDATGWTLELAPHQHVSSYYRPWQRRRSARERTGERRIAAGSRFWLLALESDSVQRDRGEHLAVLDVEAGTWRWQSKFLRRSSHFRFGGHIARTESLFVAFWDVREGGVILVLDAATGRFYRPFGVEYFVPGHGWEKADLPNLRQLAGGRLCDANIRYSYCVDLRRSQLIYSQGARLRVVDRRAVTEKIFGKLP